LWSSTDQFIERDILKNDVRGRKVFKPTFKTISFNKKGIIMAANLQKG